MVGKRVKGTDLLFEVYEEFYTRGRVYIVRANTLYPNGVVYVDDRQGGGYISYNPSRFKLVNPTYIGGE